MIQRIQSLYILLATGLTTATAFLSPMLFSRTGEVFKLGFMGVFNTAGGDSVYSTVPLTLLLLISAGISLVSFFLFKNRVLQMRLSVFSLVLMLGYYPMMFYYKMLINKELETIATFGFPVVFPVVGAILSFLAIRAIGKDEALVRSLDRIR